MTTERYGKQHRVSWLLYLHQQYSVVEGSASGKKPEAEESQQADEDSLYLAKALRKELTGLKAVIR